MECASIKRRRRSNALRKIQRVRIIHQKRIDFPAVQLVSIKHHRLSYSFAVLAELWPKVYSAKILDQNVQSIGARRKIDGNAALIEPPVERSNLTTIQENRRVVAHFVDDEIALRRSIHARAIQNVAVRLPNFFHRLGPRTFDRLAEAFP